MRVKIAVIVAAVVLVCGTVAWADNSFEGFQIVKVVFNQQEVVSDVPAVNFFGHTVLPLRKIAELAGLTVDKWDPQTNTVYVSNAAATVNGEVISKQEIYDRMAAQYGAGLLNDLIQEKLVEQAGRQAGITVTTAEVDQAIDQIKQQVGGEAQFQTALMQNNITLEQLRNFQQMRLTMTKVLAPSIPVNEDLLKQYFTDNSARFDSRRVHARHILVATEQEAKEIKAQLDKGADFAELAKAKSTDPSAKTNGGDLGTFGRGQMVAEFDRVVFSLAKGETSQPFQSQYGWHVAQVLDVTGTTPDFETSKSAVRDAYMNEKVNEQASGWLNGLRAKAVITNTLETK